MGFEHVDSVLESDRYSGVKKAVLVALAKCINNKRAVKGDYEVWPGLKALCAYSGWKRRAVQIAIDELCADTNPVVEITSEGVGCESTHYIIHMDRVVCETPQGYSGRRATSGVREAPGVGCETHPNQEYNRRIGTQETNAADGGAGRPGRDAEFVASLTPADLAAMELLDD